MDAGGDEGVGGRFGSTGRKGGEGEDEELGLGLGFGQGETVLRS